MDKEISPNKVHRDLMAGKGIDKPAEKELIDPLKDAQSMVDEKKPLRKTVWSINLTR